MTQTYLDTSQVTGRCVCDNCGSLWQVDDLDAISDVGERVMAGHTAPAGQCPNADCGELVYPVTYDKYSAEGLLKTAKRDRDNLRNHLETMIEYLTESHQSELANRHYGERKADCSYCREMKKARKLLERTAR